MAGMRDRQRSMIITLAEWKLENPDAATRAKPWWLVSGTGQVEVSQKEPPAAQPRRTAADSSFPVEEPPAIRQLIIRRKTAQSALEGARES
jgi:hypothetical protein